MKQKKLVLIDGHALAYRAYFALRPTNLATRSGEPTAGVYGFALMLLAVLEEIQPEYIAVAFDVGETFRHRQYAEYKATRDKMPDDLHPQMKRIHQLVEAFNMPVFAIDGYEADDVLGTLARQASEQGVETIIVTGDRDAFQLIGPLVKVLISGRRFSDRQVYDEAAIRERYGLSPAQLIEMKGLVGDKSDNIPGVRGIGEKTAVKLLQQYGTLEGIYAHLDELPKGIRAKLEAGRADAFLSRELGRIVTDMPIALNLDACRLVDYDRKRVVALFRELEFRSLMGRLPGSQAEPVPSGPATQLSLFGESSAEREDIPPPTETHVVADAESLAEVMPRLKKASSVTLDVETTSQDAMAARLVGIALTDVAGRGYYLPVGHESGPNLDVEAVLQALRPVLQDENITKCAHNAKYDLIVLAEHGADGVRGLLFDTMIAEWLVNPGNTGLSLKNLAWVRLGVEMTPISELIGTGKNQTTMAHVPVERVAPYAAADVDMTHRLVPLLTAELKERNQWSLFTDVEMPLVPVLMHMERAGVRLDVAALATMSDELRKRLAELETRIQKIVGQPINVNSTQQLSDALFTVLGLPTKGLKKTKSGHYSTAANVLERLRGQHEVVDLILEHRQLSKLKSTYVDTLPKLVNPRTGRVHTSYNQTGAVTGRLSSSRPNLQNIPIRTELGREVRRAFVADEGCRLVAADYSQVELRVLAHISQDPGLLSAFERGEDIHASTAAAILGVPLSEVTPEQRRLAKSVNFGLSYGQTAYGLAKQTGLSQEEASKFIAAYFEKYPGVRKYIERIKRQVAERGYVETLLGRRRYFPNLAQMRGAERRRAEREAVNMPVQGSSADIIKIAMIRLYREIKERGLRCRMVLQVHDELVLETPEDEVETVVPLVREVMEGAFPLDAALKVDVGVGENWLEVK